MGAILASGPVAACGGSSIDAGPTAPGNQNESVTNGNPNQDRICEAIEGSTAAQQALKDFFGTDGELSIEWPAQYHEAGAPYSLAWCEVISGEDRTGAGEFLMLKAADSDTPPHALAGPGLGDWYSQSEWDQYLQTHDTQGNEITEENKGHATPMIEDVTIYKLGPDTVAYIDPFGVVSARVWHKEGDKEMAFRIFGNSDYLTEIGFEDPDAFTVKVADLIYALYKEGALGNNPDNAQNIVRLNLMNQERICSAIQREPELQRALEDVFGTNTGLTIKPPLNRYEPGETYSLAKCDVTVDDPDKEGSNYINIAVADSNMPGEMAGPFFDNYWYTREAWEQHMSKYGLDGYEIPEGDTTTKSMLDSYTRVDLGSDAVAYVAHGGAKISIWAWRMTEDGTERASRIEGRSDLISELNKDRANSLLVNLVSRMDKYGALR